MINVDMDYDSLYNDLMLAIDTGYNEEIQEFSTQDATEAVIDVLEKYGLLVFMNEN